MTSVLPPTNERLRIALHGAVQGVGFRPTIYRLAQTMRLSGWVRNTDAGLEIEVEGEPEEVRTFMLRLREATPAAAVIATEQIFSVVPCGGHGFEILPSMSPINNGFPDGGPRLASILPDLATCSECLAEMLDPGDRRFRYPFTNCTQCGPRYSIVLNIPYDRSTTTMERFQLCRSCRREYEATRDRRFHAQPNACATCGPQLWLVPAEPDPSAVFAKIAAALAQGKIVAAKGIGGFQLLVDARSSSAVVRLRQRKKRNYKPFAMLMPTPECVDRYCEMNAEEQSLLLSAAAPVVLLKTKWAGDLAAQVSQHSSYIGVMLPSSPIHHLLMAQYPYPLVATSGNIADEPIAIDNEEALARLASVADIFLLHDRPIAHACDDSVVRVLDSPQILRRARGYAPLPVVLPCNLRPVLAVGGHLKNTVAIGFGRQVWLSQHIGDLDSPETRDAFEQTIEDLCKLYRFKPEVIVTFGGDGGLNTHVDHTMVSCFVTAAFHWAGRENRVV